jgi:hypothetical protein
VVLFQGDVPHSIRSLLGQVPDPERDGVALLRAANNAPALEEMAGELHEDERWRQTPLAALLPGIEGLDGSGHTFPPPIGVRAANCLLRGRISNWSSLGAQTPAELGDLPRAGRLTVEEILGAAIREWGHFYLRDTELGTDPLRIYESLLTLSAWGAVRWGTDDPVAAVAAAAEASDGLPPEVATALRTLRRIRPRTDQPCPSLEQAFIELEETPGFRTFERRQLDDPADRPTLAELAEELGTSSSRQGQLEASVRRKLARQMQVPTWPIRLAVEELREMLGTVAGSNELDKAFASLDSGTLQEPSGHSRRRRLLLWLCDYRIDGEWILSPDIERLTAIILDAVASGENTGFDTASRHLSLLGVREDVQLPWILSRSGFRLIDDKIVPLDS